MFSNNTYRFNRKYLQTDALRLSFSGVERLRNTLQNRNEEDITVEIS